MKKLLLTLTCIVLTLTVFTQSESWFNGSFLVSFNKGISTKFEWMHRRQTAENRINPFERSHIFALRPWVEFKHQKQLFSFSPLAIFETEPLNTAETRKFEQRISIAQKYSTPFHNHWVFGQRNQLEYRHFKNKLERAWRIRTQFYFQYKLNESWKMKASVENVFSLSQFQTSFQSNQLRFSFEVEYAINRRFKFTGSLMQFYLFKHADFHKNAVFSLQLTVHLGKLSDN